MLTGIEVRNFQSIASARIPLGRFTVVTGVTGAGKSALIRALALLAFNARGTAFIRSGQTSCTVSAGNSEEAWAVAIRRSTSRGKDAYQLAANGDTGHYTKLAGGVPEDVSKLLALGPLNFAGQFDRPFLLDETGTQIARTLGELTNVTMVLRAAQEAGRVRKEITRDLKGAEVRLAALTGQAKGFAGLKQRREAMDGAEEHLACVQQAGEALARLRQLTGALDAGQASVAAAEQVVARRAIPSLEALDVLEARLARLRELAGSHDESAASAQWLGSQVLLAEQGVKGAHQVLHDALVVAGECPLCGSKISDDGQIRR